MAFIKFRLRTCFVGISIAVAIAALVGIRMQRQRHQDLVLLFGSVENWQEIKNATEVEIQKISVSEATIAKLKDSALTKQPASMKVVVESSTRPTVAEWSQIKDKLLDKSNFQHLYYSSNEAPTIRIVILPKQGDAPGLGLYFFMRIKLMWTVQKGSIVGSGNFRTTGVDLAGLLE